MDSTLGPLDSGSARVLRLGSEAGAARLNEGTDAEQNEDEAEGGHDGLHLGCSGTGDGVAGEHLEEADEAGDGAEEAEQADGDGDVHEEHAAFGVGRAGESAEDDEEEADEGGDQGVDVAVDREGGDAKDDEQNAEEDGELCQVGDSFVEGTIFEA